MPIRYAPGWSLVAIGIVLASLAACGPVGQSPPPAGNGVAVRVIVEGPGRITFGPVFACFDDCVWILPADEAVAITANESPGSTFVAWSGDCPTFPQTCNRVFEDGDTVTAKFAKHALRLRLEGDGQGVFTIAGGGIDVDCDADCGIALQQPLQLAIQAQPSAGTNLGAWGGACADAPLPSYCLVQVTGGVDVSKRWVHPPVAVDDSYDIFRNASLVVAAAEGVLANDLDTPGDVLTAELVSGVAHGTLSLAADGGFTYTPAPGFFGIDGFAYRARDAFGNRSNTASVILTVVNRAPVAVDDAYEVRASTTLTIPAPGVLENDSDPDGDPLTAILETDATHGTLELDPDGGFTYTPDDGYAGEDTFTYRASDGDLQSEIATVTITVRPNRPPVAVDDAYEVTAGETLTVPAPGVLENDTDPDGDPLTAELSTDVSHGTLELDPDGGFAYTPDDGYAGEDTFTYRASDGELYSEPATVAITVLEVNRPPVAVDDAYEVVTNGTLEVPAPGVLENDTDPDGDPLTAELSTDVSHGSLTLFADGGFVYTPEEDYEGIDSFTYRAFDGELYSEPATVTITVEAPEEEPEP